MAEFDISDWSDFVRGVVNPETAERMRHHLESAPAATRRRVAALERVAELGQADRDDTVPAHAVRIAKAIASVRRPESASHTATAPQRGLAALRRLRLAITFDSLLAPAPVGTRNLASHHRQIILEVEGYRVDLAVELERRGTVAVGQVTSTYDEAKTFEGVPILVFAGEREIDHGLTSPHGEFQFEGLPQDELELCMVVGEDFLEIPLSTQQIDLEEAGS